MSETTTRTAVATRPRAFVTVTGPQACEYLQRLVSNDVAALAPGEACDALLLTPKARIIATLRVLRRSADGFLLLTEPVLGEIVRGQLVRGRLGTRCEIGLAEYESYLWLGEPPPDGMAVRSPDYGVPAFEMIGVPLPSDAPRLDAEELERLRIEAGQPAWGKEIDDRILPAEAGLDEHAISFTKGCYPGQEPVARLHYRGHANRSLRRLRIAAADPPEYDAEILWDGRAVGRVTSAITVDGAVSALGYVRTEVPDDAEASVVGAAATMSRSRP
jgi:folate-binding protein YgfZ